MASFQDAAWLDMRNSPHKTLFETFRWSCFYMSLQCSNFFASFFGGGRVAGFLASNWWLAEGVQMPREIAS